MTGQVKEDILSRFNELGLIIENGEIKISPVLQQVGDLIQGESGGASFTYCNTPFIYKKGGKKFITVCWNDNTTSSLNLYSNIISGDISEHIFNRSGRISQIIVYL